MTVLPKGSDNGENAACLGGWQLMVSAYSQVPDAAADLVRYLTSPEIQKKHAIDLGLLPTLPALYSDSEVCQEKSHGLRVRWTFSPTRLLVLRRLPALTTVRFPAVCLRMLIKYSAARNQPRRSPSN